MSTIVKNALTRLTRSRARAVRRSPCARGAQPEEARRAKWYPISRWYLRPAAGRLAALLAPTRIRPNHLTLCGLAFGAAAAAVLLWRPETAPVAAVFVLAAWFFDRADGQLARQQETASARGAWLDANCDELVDVGVHVALAAAAASQAGSSGPWLLLVAFLAGKYLFMHGLATEEHAANEVVEEVAEEVGSEVANEAAASSAQSAGASQASTAVRWLRAAYHLPGNADVRVHLLAAALLAGWLSAELAVVAVYYNLRWIARCVLVVRRLGGRP